MILEKYIRKARIGRRAYKRAYRLKNRDRLRAYDRDHPLKNRDKKRTYLKAYRRKNQDRRRAYNRNLFEQWVALRAPQADSERMGKEWLLNNGFQYVYMFADYLNGTEKDTYPQRFPFDYYAEKNGERWFVDATVGLSKRVDVNVIRAFPRFARIGILFVGKERSYLIEKRRPELRNLSLKPSTIRAIRGVRESSSDGCGWNRNNCMPTQQKRIVVEACLPTSVAERVKNQWSTSSMRKPAWKSATLY